MNNIDYYIVFLMFLSVFSLYIVANNTFDKSKIVFFKIVFLISFGVLAYLFLAL